ncbi:MAG: iron ABC transporter permease [Gemmatimonadetes bacterium]|nr:iron ABC transporter permease [Gemmatimonadota bacterium]
MRSAGWTQWAGAIAALTIALALALAVGAVPVPLTALREALTGTGDPMVAAVVRDLRAPRALLAALVGAGLGLSGGALQGTLRNPLAEPYLLGVSGGAAVGAVIAMAAGAAHPALVTGSAFLGAALATLVVALLARAPGRPTDTRLLVMAGVVVGAFANAVIMVALADAPPDRVRGALWWMMGSVAEASWDAVARTGMALAALGGALLWWARDLDVLALGEEPAAALGVDVDRTARRIFLAASWLAAATVAAAGLVGFVGLVVPAVARAAGARTHRRLLALSALVGATLLVLADLAARTARAPAELPLGAVTALVGVPFFLHRLRRVAG